MANALNPVRTMYAYIFHFEGHSISSCPYPVVLIDPEDDTGPSELIVAVNLSSTRTVDQQADDYASIARQSRHTHIKYTFM